MTTTMLPIENFESRSKNSVPAPSTENVRKQMYLRICRTSARMEAMMEGDQKTASKNAAYTETLYWNIQEKMSNKISTTTAGTS